MEYILNMGQPPNVMVYVGYPSTPWHDHFLRIMAHGEFPRIYKNWDPQKDWGYLVPTGGPGSDTSPWDHKEYRDLHDILVVNGFEAGINFWGGRRFDPKSTKPPKVVKGFKEAGIKGRDKRKVVDPFDIRHT